MNRIYQINEQCDVSIIISEMNDEERSRVDRHIEDFIASHVDAQTLGEDVRQGIRQGQIATQIIERLSKWCHTGGAYTRGEEPARRLAHEILGGELPRLIDEENVRLPEYRERILWIVEQQIIPERTQYRPQRATCLTNLSNLETDILLNIIDLTQIPKDRFVEWGGAGVIVTTDPLREAAEGDVVVFTRYAHVITWFMERVRDIAADCVDYTNKYEFYGMIARKTGEFLEKHGDAEGQEKMLVLDVLRDVKRLIHTWQERSEA